MNAAASARRLSPRASGALLAVAAAACTAGMYAFVPRLPQDPAYHQFADTRTWLGVPHAGDVLGNVALVAAGAYGLLVVRRARAATRAAAASTVQAAARRAERPAALSAEEAPAWRVAYLGVFLTGFGSAWYHLRPDSTTLMWDRLPMSLTSGAMLAVVVAEFVSARAGRALLVPAVGAALGSVLWWHSSEAHGAGDLRAYGLVQFFPALALVLMLLLAAPRHAGTRGWWAVLVWFAASKVAEALDRPIWELGGVVSGHNLKHVLAGAAVVAWARLLARRTAAAVRAGEAPGPASGPATGDGPSAAGPHPYGAGSA